MTTDGLWIIDLQKEYKYWTCCWYKKDVKALKGVFLEIEDRELLCILGHNGAGKSTMIGVITGILAPSYGTAKVKGLDINEDIEEVWKIIGVVP